MVKPDGIEYLELTAIAELIRSREITSVEVTEHLLDRIATYDRDLNSFATVMTDVALKTAASADAEISRGRYRGTLHGVPVGLKDLCYTTDAPTAAGGTINAEYVPSYDATVVTRLRAAGAVPIGKLRMTEGAYAEHHPSLPTPVNPWDAETWAGVSSSGSGVATAAGLCYGALGSDTGGSIRVPSTMNGLTGLKPTWGRVSRYGIVEFAGSLDNIGPMARSARDCAAMLRVIAGADVNDPTALLDEVPNYEAELELVRRPRVGIDHSLLETFDVETRSLILSTAETLREMGWSVTEVSLPDLRGITESFLPLCAVEMAVAHKHTYPARKSEYGPALCDLIEFGLSLSAAEYQHHIELRRAMTGRMRRVLESVDILLMPGIGIASPTSEKMSTLGSDEALLSALMVPTAPFNLSGVPTVTMPAGFTDRGTPVAIQFVGRELSEGLLLQAAHAFQLTTDFHNIHPTLIST
jgi:amidase